MVTSDFLIVFHSNYGPILYSFRDKGHYLQTFPTPIPLTPPLSGFPFEFCHAGRAQKTRTMPIPDRQKSVTIMSIRLYTLHSTGIGLTDGQTD